MNKKVLVFDSGKGGQYVAEKARERYRDIDFDFLADRSGLPYGNKTPDEITQSSLQALRPIIYNYSYVIVACHTLTQVGIDDLRKGFPDIKFVGFDPGVKKAADMGFKNICVLATAASISSDKYKKLRDSFKFNTVIEPDCSTWASDIEEGSFKLETILDTAKYSGVKCIVLACTHYFWYEEYLKDNLHPSYTIINPTTAVLDQFEKLLIADLN